MRVSTPNSHAKMLRKQSRIKSNLALRARIIRAIREYFHQHDYLEVETPHRIPAPAPEANIEPQPAGEWFLHASPELCMKGLLAAGYPRIYQICRCFRQKERGASHLPEFTLLEWYMAEAGYFDMMNQCEDLIRFTARAAGIRGNLIFRGHSIDMDKPWDRITVAEAFDRFGSISVEEALEKNMFDELTDDEIEPNLGIDKPVFLYDYPASLAALARLKPGNPMISERFELYIGGLELCNAFSELTDPDEQRSRFEKENRLRSLSGKPAHPMPEVFLESLKDMPRAAGNALGIDRLVMLFTDAAEIDDVVAFTPEEL